MGVDYDLNNKVAEPKWQLESSVGRMLDVQATAAGCTLSKNWDADLGAMSCNVEVRGHCTWSGRVRPAPLARHRHRRCEPRLTRPPQPTLSIDFVPIHTVTKAVTGGIAFAVGKSLDVNPRVKLGKLPVKVRRRSWEARAARLLTRRPRQSQVEVGASIYKEGAEGGGDDVLCCKVKSVNALILL